MENIISADVVEALLKYMPVYVPAVAGVLIWLIDYLWLDDDKDVLVYAGAAVIVLDIVLFWRMWLANGAAQFFGLTVSRFALSGIIIVLVFALFSLLLGYQYFQERRTSVGLYVVFVLFATVGAISALLTNNLVFVFSGIVVMSVSTGFMMRYYGDDNTDSAVQRFWIFSLLTDLIFAFGMAFFFGATGSMNVESAVVDAINAAYTANYFRMGIALIIASLFCKMAMVPFHLPMMEVSRKFPLPIVNVVAVFCRLVAVLILLNILLPISGVWSPFFEGPVILLAASTMTFANLAAVTQRDLKEVFAYSSIAYVGYIIALLPTLVFEGNDGSEAIMFFVVTFALIHFGAFALLQLFSGEDVDNTMFENLDGLGRRHPAAAVLFTIYLFIMAGFPPMMGFLARFLAVRVFIISGNFFLLAVFAINSALGLYYLVRPVARFYLFKPTEKTVQMGDLSYPLIIAVAFAFLAAFYLGILPAPFIRWIELSSSGF